MSRLFTISAIAVAATLSAGVTAVTATDPAEFVAVSGSGSFYGAENASGTSEMDDPRVSGRWQINQELLCSPEAGYTCAKWGEASLSNTGGTWEGEWAGSHRPGGTELGDHYITAWLRGTGDYDGLYLVVSFMGPASDTAIEGVIYEGPFPETVALGAGETTAE